MEKKVKVIDGYYYCIDNCGNHSLYLSEVREKGSFGNKETKTGVYGMYTELIGHFTSVEGVLKGVVRDSAKRKIDAGQIETVKQHLDYLNKITERIEKVTGGF